MSPLTRRDLLRAGGAGAGLALLGGGYALLGDGDGGEDARGPGRRHEPASPAAPNVLVVVIDSLRADSVGAYGSGRVRTPSLDALAREGLRFTRARPEAFPTVAARRAILTGKRSFPFDDWRAHPGLPAGPGWTPIRRGERTFLDDLGAAGYRTGYVTDNPWMLSQPFDRFRRTVELPEGVGGQVPARRPSRRSVPESELSPYILPSQRGTRVEARIRAYIAENGGRRGEDDYPTARVFRGASSWLREARESRPFALVVDAFGPHEPFDPPPSQVGRYGDARRAGGEPIQPFAPPIGKLGEDGLTEDLLERIRELYAAEVSFADMWLGRMLDELDALDLAGETLVVVLSDHGVLLGERGFVGKTGAQSHREVIEVPYLIRHPDGRAAARTSDFFASTHDVAPTVLSVLGLPIPERMEGADLSPLLDSEAPVKRPYFTASYGRHVVAGDGRWLLISDNEGSARRLYDTHSDPAEERDVATSNARRVDRLWQRLLDDAGGELPTFDTDGVVQQ